MIKPEIQTTTEFPCFNVVAVPYKTPGTSAYGTGDVDKEEQVTKTNSPYLC